MKTVPLDNITDCDVKEPAGASGPICCLVQNVVPVVHVDTASSGTIATENGVMTTHELELHGLVDPYAFKINPSLLRKSYSIISISILSSTTG